MFTRYDKAWVTAIGTGLTGFLLAATTLDPEVVASLGTLITAGLTFLIPNKGA